MLQLAIQASGSAKTAPTIIFGIFMIFIVGFGGLEAFRGHDLLKFSENSKKL